MKPIRYLLLILFISLMHFSTTAQDSVVDGIVAIVGGRIILKSDVEAQYLQYRAQGNITGSPVRVKCQILENILYQKLLYHQADVDSIIISDSQVGSEIDRRMRYFISQAGSPERLEEMYNKSLMEIKEEMSEIIREQMMVEQEQQKITENVSVTPAEVKAFFRKIPKDSIPEISAEVEIGIISRRPEIGEQQMQLAREQVEGFKERVQNGDDFATLAILYSEDPASAKQGGELGMFQRGDMRPKFEAAAFKLKPEEVSDIVETPDGFHLIQMIERRGDFFNVRHILVQPKVSPIELNNAKLFLDSIASKIQNKEVNFANAVLRYSDDPSRNNGGMLINQVSGNTRFEIEQVDPKIFFVIDKLKVGEISAPVKWEERGKEFFRIYYLKERSTPHYANLSDDYARIQQWKLDEKKMKEIEKWVDKKVDESFVQIMSPYIDCTFDRDWVTK
ncbi:MAG: peptidylprolyl isomerase [Bacteroidetes bacterium]|nr:peptidylprolyl isomerase [Bacteroidota bacterium]